MFFSLNENKLLQLTWKADDFWPSDDGRYVLLRQSIESVWGQQRYFYAVYNTVER